MHSFLFHYAAAMAFGTGHHGTTLGCLRALETLLGKGFEAERVADIGCGTAVLAMAAALDLPVIPHGSSVFSCETPVRPCRSFAS